MADSARPVSGEIMTEPAAWFSEGPVARDVVDADYVVLSGPELSDFDPAPASDPQISRAQIPAPSLEGMAMLRPADPIRPFSASGGPLFWGAGVAAALAAFWISGGHALIRHSTLFEAAIGARPALSILGVTSHVDASGEKPVLFVDGEAGNDGRESAALPPLEIRVTGDDGIITRYTLGTSGRALAPGQRFAFSSRLDVSGNGVKAVAVSFAQ
jgi:hypothetical protein